MGTELNDQATTVARAFVQARREARGLPDYPGIAPGDLAGAYGIQDRAIGLDGRDIVGWKVGRINPPLDGELGSNRLSGPIFADSVVDAVAGSAPQMPVFAEGFAAAEAEILLHVAPGFAGPVPTDDAETIAVLDDVRIGIEIASSPYPGINAGGPAVTVSDFGNNAGLVRGAVLEGWRTLDLCAIPVRAEIDGKVVGEATAATMLDGPFGAVRFLLANLIARGFDVSRGLWVSSGAITGVHEIAVGQHFRAVFGTHGTVSCGIVAATPR
ncbi:2-keto-4-pentenoate hydratase [Novosphingobium sp. UBA1939]|uniref:2-keto-4-pentenoate hydratase n=1 Tax=Novosphingobium sp. UBA1939 TaxID=1946982 RepID=UPI0025F640B8|nr:2-keto-4-pentenoate hydratase [Novosphingobium sp. UBA1939]